VIRILHITTRHNVGGISKIMINLLSDEVFQQNYLTGYCEENEIEYSFESNSINYNLYRVFRLRRSINAVNDFVAFLQIVRIMRDIRPDVVHTHMSKAGVLGRIAALFLTPRPKLIHSYHGHALDNYFNRYLNFLFRLIEKKLGLITEVLQFDGNSVFTEIQSFGIKPRLKSITIVPGSINDLEPPKLIENISKTFHILVVGRIEPIKGIDTVITIASKLKQENLVKDFRITIIGDGSMRSKYEGISKRMGLPIQFTGWKASISEFYQNADMFLSVSLSEGTPISFMEAASFSLPIVAFNVGSVGDLVEQGQTGFLANEIDELNRHIEYLYQNKEERIRLGKNARVKAQKEFMSKIFVDKQRQIYFDILSIT